MNAIRYTHTMPYTYTEHAGAHYLIGGKYKNHGEYLESVVKHHMGLDYEVNPATSYNEGSDIESLNASVKSSKASLACVYGETYEEIKAEYFANVHSTTWIYVADQGNDITEYHMNRYEFEHFLDLFHTMQAEAGHADRIKVKLKAESKAMLRWLENMVGVA